ncbi:hypothetical protein NLX85_19075 [Micromonospora sp. A3M-1-15]|uniref:hypothetical protein n=1 Tax=Micromonospora sp. A3M-1-15 TaxID=2962035 RepID=UPI0020B6EFF4|nr:hypothetical protein [Micromonospora sp. A3M-1-15]MCP3785467.1 hypothetical protein [Micromonospora sp. A3M-1-15]
MALGLLSVLQAPGGGRGPRSLHFLVTWVRHPVLFARSLSKRRWSGRTTIGLVMQSLDNSLTVSAKKVRRGKAKLTSRQGHGAPTPDLDPRRRAGGPPARPRTAEPSTTLIPGCP